MEPYTYLSEGPADTLHRLLLQPPNTEKAAVVWIKTLLTLYRDHPDLITHQVRDIRLSEVLFPESSTKIGIQLGNIGGQ